VTAQSKKPSPSASQVAGTRARWTAWGWLELKSTVPTHAVAMPVADTPTISAETAVFSPKGAAVVSTCHAAGPGTGAKPSPTATEVETSVMALGQCTVTPPTSPRKAARTAVSPPVVGASEVTVKFRPSSTGTTVPEGRQTLRPSEPSTRQT
jgi:hypothetical protein